MKKMKNKENVNVREKYADYAVARCPSVCLSHAGILSKRLNISCSRTHVNVSFEMLSIHRVCSQYAFQLFMICFSSCQLC